MTLAACIILAGACKKNVEVPKVSYETMTVKKCDRTIKMSFSAKMVGLQDVSILPQVSGTITEIAVTEGQLVKKGQKLFVIDRTPFALDVKTAEANTAAAQAQLATAKLNYESNKDLYNKKIVSRYVLETAENSYNTAKATLAQAQAQEAQAKYNLNHCTVTSPANGVVGTIDYRVGDLVSPSMPTPLTVVSDNSVMTASFSLNEKDYTELKAKYGALMNSDKRFQGMPDVEFKQKDGTIFNQPGRITSMAGVVDVLTGSVVCKADFPNPDRILNSGVSGSVLLPFNYQDIIVIPLTATVQTQDKIAVYKVNSSGKAVYTIIEVAPTNDGKEYIVLSGLKAGDEIVAKGANTVQDGAQVKF